MRCSGWWLELNARFASPAPPRSIRAVTAVTALLIEVPRMRWVLEKDPVRHSSLLPPVRAARRGSLLLAIKKVYGSTFSNVAHVALPHAPNSSKHTWRWRDSSAG